MVVRIISFTFIVLLLAYAGTGMPCVRADVPPRTVAPIERFDVNILSVQRFGGLGRPLIFIPALFCGAWQWNGQIAVLSERYDVYVVTLPGFDGRPRIEPHHLIERTVSAISRLIAVRHLVKPVIIGHSLGGTLAVRFGQEYSNEAAGIIAVEGGHPVAATAAARLAYVTRATAPFRSSTSHRSFDRALRSMLRYVITSPADIDTVAKLAERSDPQAIADWMRAALILDLTPQLRFIRTAFVEIVPFDATIDPYVGYPTLETKRRAYESWVAKAPGAHGVVMIEKSRHFVMFDQPSSFDRTLLDEVERMERAAK